MVRESRVPFLTKDVRSTPGNSFACAAVSRQAWSDIGELDAAAFPTDSNDADFAARALAKSLRHIYAGNVIVEHAPGSSGSRETDKVAIRERMRQRHGDLLRWQGLTPRQDWYRIRLRTPFGATMSKITGRRRRLTIMSVAFAWRIFHRLRRAGSGAAPTV